MCYNENGDSMKKETLEDLFFLVLFIFFWLISGFFFIRNRTVDNLVANRKSYRFEPFQINDFIEKTYQDHMEEAIRDQMPKYQYFQLIYPKIKNYINYQTSSFFLDSSNQYVQLGDIYEYQDYLLYEPIKEEDLTTVYQKNLDKIHTIIDNTSAQVYVYYINGDTNIHFANKTFVNVDQYMESSFLPKGHYSSLKISSFEDYKKYYYQLDHHLNHRGSQKMYEDLVSLLSLENPLSIENEICFKDKKVYGSKAKVLALNSMLKETICVFSYPYPNYTIEANQVPIEEYGSSISSLKEKKELSYATIYGADYGELIFTNPQANNHKKLLVFSNSYSNSINQLLANHYEKTYVIDGRYNNQFDFIKYVEEQNIDDVLILASKMLFFDQVHWGDF